VAEFLHNPCSKVFVCFIANSERLKVSDLRWMSVSTPTGQVIREQQQIRTQVIHQIANDRPSAWSHPL